MRPGGAPPRLPPLSPGKGAERPAREGGVAESLDFRDPPEVIQAPFLP